MLFFYNFYKKRFFSWRFNELAYKIAEKQNVSDKLDYPNICKQDIFHLTDRYT